MTKKQILTSTTIEKDIINAIKQPADISKASYKKLLPFAFIAAILLVVAEIFYPQFILWALLALVIYFLGYYIYKQVSLKKTIKNLSIDDFYITTEIVHSTNEEHYKIHGNKWRRGEWKNIYTICFENGKSWRIPKDNYLWSVERLMSDFAIFQSTNRGDIMLIVAKKDTNEIVMAYHTDFFQCKNQNCPISTLTK